MSVYRIVYDKKSNKIYEGEFEGEFREGRGSLYYSSGEIKYIGEWSKDVPHGNGVLFYENRMKFYEGEWRNGVATGQGTLFTEKGRREYEGQFAESKKNGIGTIYYEDGSSYKGEWRDDRREGFGSLFYDMGDLNYRGDWVDSKKHGNGILLKKGNILEYKGEFFEDKKHGVGKSYYLDGKIEYDGFWENDKKSGQGILYGIDGIKVFEGMFKAGKQIEEVKIKHSDEKAEHIRMNLERENEYNTLDLTGEIGSIINDESEGFEDDMSIIIDKKSMNFVVYDEEKENEKRLMSYVNEGIEVIDYDEKNQKKIQEENLLDKCIEENQEQEAQIEIVEINDDEVGEFCVEQDYIKDEVCCENYIEAEIKSESLVEENKKESVVNNDEWKEKKEFTKIIVEENKVYKYIEIDDIAYKGEFHEGDKTGFGKVYYKGILQYEGFLKVGVYDGKGKLYDSSEKVEFDGIFKNGKKNGKGTSYDSFGNPIYIGEWKNDFQDGAGELLNSNGEKIYIGMFYKGKALGLGIAIEKEIDNILYCELESMVGLEEVKHDLARLVSFLKMQILRERVSYKPMDIPYIFTFEGNIGIGKETVARILGKLYYILCLIPEYNFIQKDLVEALETSEDREIEKSMDKFGGGVLYLNNLYESEYEDITDVIKSKSSTDNILDLLEYSNGHFIIIFSGNEELIEKMIHNKKELARCIGKSISFFDYSVEEMMEYILGLSTEKDYILSSDLINELKSFFTELLDDEKYTNRNGEFINELFTEIVKEQCIRIDTCGVVNIENLRVLEVQDFKNIENKICF